MGLLVSFSKTKVNQTIYVNTLGTTHSIVGEWIEPQGQGKKDSRLDVGKLYEIGVCELN